MTKIKLSDEINNALSIIGYNQLMPIQEKVIPLLLEEKDIVVQAKTGSGKTASFAIPICENIGWEENAPQALVLACTRELVVQIKKEFSNIGKFKKIKATAIYGKEKMSYQSDALKQKCHVVIATPGRLLDHIECGSIDLSKIKYVVLDEADYMLDMGFVEQVEEILKELPEDRVTALFSATYPKRILSLVDDFTKDAIEVGIESESNIEHFYTYTDNPYPVLLGLLSSQKIESALIFCEMQSDVDELYYKLGQKGVNTLRIHGGLRQDERFKSLEAFRKGDCRLLIATDVAARGIDIEKVSHVFHYSFPHTMVEYTHRSGRSGRIDEKGTSIILVNHDNDLLKQLRGNFDLREIEAPNEKDRINLKEINKKVKKQEKDKKFNNVIDKVFIGAGKEKKIRVVDIIGALCSLDDISQDDIGIVEVLQKMSYVEILNNKGASVVKQLQTKTIKNKKVKVELANLE